MDKLKIDCDSSIGSFVVEEYSNGDSSRITASEKLPSCCVDCDICQDLKEDFYGMTNAEQWEQDWCASHWFQSVLKELSTGKYSKEEMIKIALDVSTYFTAPYVDQIKDPEQKYLKDRFSVILGKEKNEK